MASVIAGFDGSAGSRAALHWAVREARLRRLPVRALTFLDGLDQPDAPTEADLDAIRSQLVPAVLALNADQQIDYQVVAGSPQAGLIAACTAEDLLVVGSRGRNPLTELLLGSVSHACLHAAPCAVAIIPIGEEHPRQHNRVIVGVDGSAPARRALRVAAAEARLREASLHALHAVYWVPIGAELATPDDQQLVNWGRHLVAAELRETHVAARPVVVPGHAGQVLTRHSEHADLLVVGSRGRGPLVSLLAGSTADYCARHARCPVLITR